MRIDLHAHSTASDGTDSPAELVAAAGAAGLDVLALTDHDTTAGWEQALAAAGPGLRVVPGAELSTVSRDGRGGTATVHLLAYRFDPAVPAVVAEQARLRAERRRRLGAMVRAMAADGHPVDESTVFAGLAADASAGRPHLAAALVRAGVVGSVGEAFDRFLRTGGRYYLEAVRTPVDQAVAMIAAAGGVTVMAHPLASGRGPVVEAEVIAELAGLGLAGIEVDHPEHGAAERRMLRGLAAELGLVVTGGSDYHGRNKPVRLGTEITEPAAFEALFCT